MSFSNPLPAVTGGDMSAADQDSVGQVIDRLAHHLANQLDAMGLERYDSPLFRPWNMAVALGRDQVRVVFGERVGGMADVKWLDVRPRLASDVDLAASVQRQLGWTVIAQAVLPLPSESSDDLLVGIAHELAADARDAQRLSGVDLVGLEHLAPYVDAFLSDHPIVAKNVFLMMRFRQTDHHHQIESALRNSAAELGLSVVRADDRDYTGDLWSNVELCMRCCQLGVAVFEDIDERDFNPNISLEVGYMMALRRRVMLLKEKRLTALPADVVHKLYRPFDMFHIEETVSAEFTRWVKIDLRLA